MGVGLAYSTWETAQHHLVEAASLGAILGASFLQALFVTVLGLAFGGRYRALPRGMSWSFYQKLAMVRCVSACVHVYAACGT